MMYILTIEVLIEMLFYESKQYEPQNANINTRCHKAPARSVPVTFPGEKMHKY